MNSPLEQFEITPLLYVFRFFEFFGTPVTNFSLFAVVISVLFFTYALISTFRLKLIPTIRQYTFEFLYEFVLGIITSNLGTKGTKFFPYVFFLFFFILVFNLFGLFPNSFTLTSQIVVACMLSFTTFFGLILLTLVKHRLNFFALFFPSEAPVALAFLLVPIELVSFFSRPFSLAIRLFANMTAGHVLLKILGGFTIVLLSNLTGFIFSFSFLLRLGHDFDDLLFVDQVYVGVSQIPYVTYTYLDAFFCLDLEEYINFPVTEPNYEEIESVRPVPTVVALYRAYSSNVKLFLYLFDGDPRMFALFFFAAGGFICNLDDVVVPLEFLAITLDPLNFVFPEAGFFLSIGFFCDFILSIFNFLFVIVAALIPIVVLMFFIVLELFVAALQAYVFCILTVIYLREALELH